MDPFIMSNLENLNYSRVLVFLGSTASVSLLKKIESNFLTSIPLEVASLSKQNDLTFIHYPRLGIYFGYMNGRGVKNTEELNVEVEGADVLLPIQPVFEQEASTDRGGNWGISHIGIEKLWTIGLTGKGVRVGHLDTGVDGDHNILRDKVKIFFETRLDGTLINRSIKPHDNELHGTHTAGIICGGKENDYPIGVAPESELVSGIVVNYGETTARILTGLEKILEHQVPIVNLSLGLTGYRKFAIKIIKTLRENGTLPIVAIGNEGPGISRSPGNYVESLSVGAIDKNNHIGNYSGSGVFEGETERVQPDVLAPGTEILSAKAGGGLLYDTGTSEACPFVSGLAAILLQSQPGSTIEQIEKAIIETSVLLPTFSNDRCAYGLINPEAAVKRLEALINE